MMMLFLHKMNGRKANLNRWETLKLLDWEKDAEIIEWICAVKNPNFFISHNPEQAITYARDDIEQKKLFEKNYKKYEEWKKSRA